MLIFKEMRQVLKISDRFVANRTDRSVLSGDIDHKKLTVS